MIIAGESSGELYGSLLAAELKRRRPDLKITGVGGKKMQAAGVDLIDGIVGSIGVFEALAHLISLKATFDKILNTFRNSNIDLLVLIDYPEFNLRIAERAKKLGIPIIYYVSPQIWAWRKKRIHNIGYLSDKIAVILPFEEKVYRNAGIDCRFVGHPVSEDISRLKGNVDISITEFQRDPERPVMALFPGSRRSELRRHLPLILNTVRLMKVRYPAFQYILPFAPDIERSEFFGILSAIEREGVTIAESKALEVLSISDMAVIASGTSTLQAALLGVPMVVFYKLFPLTYLLGRVLIKVKYISLVNLISEKEVVKELIQYDARPEKIVDELGKIYESENYKAEIKESLGKLSDIFMDKSPTMEVADMVEELLVEKNGL